MDSPTIRMRRMCFNISLGETQIFRTQPGLQSARTSIAEKGIDLTSFNLNSCGFSFHCVFYLLAFLISVDTIFPSE